MRSVRQLSAYADAQDYDKDTSDALTDGQLGDWDDFGGDIDDVRGWAGRRLFRSVLHVASGRLHRRMTSALNQPRVPVSV